MSYDLYLIKNGETVQFEAPLDVSGGTAAIGGTSEAWLNVTYNYGVCYRRIWEGEGLNRLAGMRADESVTFLRGGIDALGDETDPDYWKPTEGNAKAALRNLLVLALASPPDAVWEIC